MGPIATKGMELPGKVNLPDSVQFLHCMFAVTPRAIGVQSEVLLTQAEAHLCRSRGRHLHCVT